MNSNGNELAELQELYEKAGTQTQKLTAPLLNNAIFMSQELDKLMNTIRNGGEWVSTYRNGANQVGRTLSAEGKAYNALLKSFNSTIKSLYSILNDKMPEPEDELAKFLKKKETR